MFMRTARFLEPRNASTVIIRLTKLEVFKHGQYLKSPIPNTHLLHVTVTSMLFQTIEPTFEKPRNA